MLNPAHLSKMSSLAPLKMRITGLEPGLPLSSALSALWIDSPFSPHFFAHIGAAYIMERSAIYHRKPKLFVAVIRPHGAVDTLHLILTPPDSAQVTVRPTIGRELRTLDGTTAEGLYNAIPDYAYLSPKPIDLYVTLAATLR